MRRILVEFIVGEEYTHIIRQGDGTSIPLFPSEHLSERLFPSEGLNHLGYRDLIAVLEEAIITVMQNLDEVVKDSNGLTAADWGVANASSRRMSDLEE